MKDKTQEERRAIAAKAHATRRANKAALEADRKEALIYAGGLKQQIQALEARLAGLQQHEAAQALSAKVCNQTLLSEEQIVSAAQPYAKTTGVYFLIHNARIVYVGQALNIYSRIAQHTDKKFDSYAFVLCSQDMLNKLESLYIHTLRPPLNGTTPSGAKSAPLRLDQLLK